MKFTPELLDRLAREYVLGTLQGAARRRFETVLRRQPQAAQAVHAWSARLHRLAEAVPQAQPSPQLWRGIEQRLFAAPPAAPVRTNRAMRWWQGLGFGAAGAALCALLLLPRLQSPGVDEAEGLPASYVGLLSDAAGKPTVLASATRHGKRLSIKLLQPVAIPPGQVARLWALPDDGAAPKLIGEVPGSGKSAITLEAPADAVFAKVSRLGVSVETAPGAAQPAMPFVLTGACVKLW